MLKLLMIDFKGNKVYVIIVGLKVVNVIVYCVFFYLNCIYNLC